MLFLSFWRCTLGCLFIPFSALASKILLGASEVGRWYDVISLFCKTWCAWVKTFPRGEKSLLTAVFAGPWNWMLSSNKVEFEVLERNIPLYVNDVLVNGEELSCRLEMGERSEFVALSYESWRISSRIPFFVEMTLRHWEISLRSFEGTCSTFMSVDCLRELTSSRISRPLKFLRKVGNRLHSTASYCRQTESSAAPLAAYMCMSLAATVKVTSGRSVVAFEVTCSKKWCPACVWMAVIAFLFWLQHQHNWGQSNG